MNDFTLAPNNPAFFGSNIFLSAVTNITPPSVQAFSTVTYQGRQAYSAVARGAKWCSWVSWAVRWGTVPKRRSSRRIGKDSWETGKRHFTLDKGRTVGWLLVKVEPIEEQGTNSVRLSFQAAPGLWASSAGSREGCGFLSQVPSGPCRLFSPAALFALSTHLPHLWEQKLCQNVPDSS